jgi:hypothetical protein
VEIIIRRRKFDTLLMLGVLAVVIIGALPLNAEATRTIYFEDFYEGRGYFWGVGANDTMTEYQMVQYELGKFQPYIAPEFVGKMDVIFVDQSSQEYLDEIGGNSSIQFWAGNGSPANSLEEIDPAALVSKFDFEEAGRYSRHSNCIRVIRMDIVDERYREEDGNWQMYLTVENAGRHGVYVRAGYPGNASINARDHKNRTFIKYNYLASGERIQFALGGYPRLGERPVEIDYCCADNFFDVGNSDFRNVEEYVLTRRNVASPFIQLNNATYRVDNAEKGWNTVFLEYEATGNRTLWNMSNATWTHISFDYIDKYGESGFAAQEMSREGNATVLEKDVGRFNTSFVLGFHITSESRIYGEPELRTSSG